MLGVPVDSHSTVDRQQAQTRREPEEIRRLPHPHRPPAMEKGKGLARRWAVELHDASSSSSSHSSIPDPPGFTRSAPDAVLPLLPPPSFVQLLYSLPPPAWIAGLTRVLSWPPAGRRRRRAAAEGFRDRVEGAGELDLPLFPCVIVR